MPSRPTAPTMTAGSSRKRPWTRVGSISLVAVVVLLAGSCAPPATSDGPPEGVRSGPARSESVLSPPTQPAPAAGGSLPGPVSFVTAGTRSLLAGCTTFPRDHVFHADIRGLPVRADSSAVIAVAGEARQIHPTFSSSVWMGSRSGIPINAVDGSTAVWQRFLVGSAFGPSDGEWMPWPAEPRFEGWPSSAWDRHMVVIDTSTCRSWEAIQVQPPWENIWAGMLGRWWTDKVVSLDLTSNEVRAGGSVTAAGFSLVAGLVSFDEVASGEVDHALTLTLPEIRAGEKVWPAQGTDGRILGSLAPQMGSWFRLKSDADLSGLGPQAKVIARALQAHGAILGDTGPHAGLSGQPDTRWNDSDLATLGRFSLGDFELVDPSQMKVADDSFQIR